MRKLTLFLALLLLCLPAFGAVGDPVLETADPLLHVGDQNAGTDITADLEEEGQINTTAVTGNAADDQVLLGSGASAMAYATIPNCVAGNVLTYTQATNTFGCQADAGGAQIINFASPAELTIASGSITLTGAANTLTFNTIDTESDAGTDDLTAVVCTAGSLYVFAPADGTRTVVMQAQGGADFSMDNAADRVIAACTATNTLEFFSRANNGA